MGAGDADRYVASICKQVKNESFTCQIDSAEQFDEGGFIAALKQKVEAELNQSKAKIIGSANPDASSFYFEYTMEGTRQSGSFWQENSR